MLRSVVLKFLIRALSSQREPSSHISCNKSRALSQTKQFKTKISKTKCYLWIGITYQEKKNQTDLRLLHTNHEYASHSAQPEQPSKVSLVDRTTFRHAHEQNILQHLSNTSYFLLVSYQRLTNKGLFNENPAIRPSRRHGQFYMP